MTVDTAANRARRKYPPAEQARRIAWALLEPFFRFSPRQLFGWRRLLLRLMGAKIGKQVHVHNTARISFPWKLEIGDWSAVGDAALIYNLGPVRIGRHVTISQGAHLCAGTHDYTDPSLPLLRPPITVGDQAWICADAFVGPGVNVGEGAVLGARGVAVRDLPAWGVAVGNPARVVKQRRQQQAC